MKYLSLFSGIGGFELGFEQAYEERSRNSRLAPQDKIQEEGQKEVGSSGQGYSEEARSFRDIGQSPFVCIGYSEIDKYAIQIYEKHFPNYKNYGDITKIDPERLPDFELLCGGFPCQSFSLAGKRGGFKDTRGTLFFDIARIAKTKRPRLLLLENVKGLLSHDGGRTFNTIIVTLDELGYDLQWQVLNSKNFGVPQNRERVFIVGHLRGTPRPKVFPFGEGNEEIIETGKMKQLNRSNPQGQRVYSSEGIASTLASQAGGLGAKTGLYAIPQNSPTIRAEHHNTADVHFIPSDMKIRRLTPTECERLQGFPDGWTEGVSDTQRYKTLGNAVTVNVVREIAKRIANTPSPLL